MNNRGQVLVLFVLIIPIILGVIVLVADVGLVMNKKISIDEKIELVIEYGLDDEMDLVELEELVDYNLNDCTNEVSIVDGVITINTKTYLDGIISNVIGIRGFSIESEFRGYLEDDKNIIEKVK